MIPPRRYEEAEPENAAFGFVPGIALPIPKKAYSTASLSKRRFTGELGRYDALSLLGGNRQVRPNRLGAVIGSPKQFCLGNYSLSAVVSSGGIIAHLCLERQMKSVPYKRVEEYVALHEN